MKEKVKEFIRKTAPNSVDKLNETVFPILMLQFDKDSFDYEPLMDNYQDHQYNTLEHVLNEMNKDEYKIHIENGKMNILKMVNKKK